MEVFHTLPLEQQSCLPFVSISLLLQRVVPEWTAVLSLARGAHLPSLSHLLLFSFEQVFGVSMGLEPGPAMSAIVETFIQLPGVPAPKPYQLAIAEGRSC